MLVSHSLVKTLDTAGVVGYQAVDRLNPVMNGWATSLRVQEVAGIEEMGLRLCFSGISLEARQSGSIYE
jgi:hypothetical protein